MVGIYRLSVFDMFATALKKSLYCSYAPP
jgi:hypothetical protein